MFHATRIHVFTLGHLGVNLHLAMFHVVEEHDKLYQHATMKMEIQLLCITVSVIHSSKVCPIFKYFSGLYNFCSKTEYNRYLPMLNELYQSRNKNMVKT